MRMAAWACRWEGRMAGHSLAAVPGVTRHAAGQGRWRSCQPKAQLTRIGRMN